jgi:hypothetical protein
MASTIASTFEEHMTRMTRDEHSKKQGHFTGRGRSGAAGAAELQLGVPVAVAVAVAAASAST